MKLPDFDADTEFRRLRALMGAHQDGVFGADRWPGLSLSGVEVDPTDVQINAEGLLSFDGKHVLVFIRDQLQYPDAPRPEGYRYHLTMCRALDRMWAADKAKRYVATTRKDGLFVVNFLNSFSGAVIEANVEHRLKVCKDCLRGLDWDGYATGPKAARVEIHRSFDPEAFFSVYGGTLVPAFGGPRRNATSSASPDPGTRPTRAPVGRDRGPPATPPAPSTHGHAVAWYQSIPDQRLHPALAHLDEHKSLNEVDCVKLLGAPPAGPRLTRRLFNSVDVWSAAAPYKVHVGTWSGTRELRR